MKFTIEIDDELIEEIADLSAKPRDEIVKVFERVFKGLEISYNAAVREGIEIITNAPEDADIGEICNLVMAKAIEDFTKFLEVEE